MLLGQSPLPMYTDFIKAIADLAWPIIIAVLLIVYRKEVKALLRGLRRAKFMGIEIEEVERAATEATKAEEASQQGVPAPVALSDEAKKEELEWRRKEQAYRTQILNMASKDRSTAMLRTFNEVDNEMRTMVATMGLLQFRKRYPPSFAGHVQMLRSRGYITQELHDLLLSFRSLRNHIVHRVADVPDNAYVSVLDTGIRLLGMLRAIPREINQVAFANVPFYSDRECLDKVQDARAVILETTHPDAQQKTRRIFPSTRSYGSGQVLSWEWNSGKRWGESWYRDPQTDEIRHAWSGSLEFVGRPLETIEHY